MNSQDAAPLSCEPDWLTEDEAAAHVRRTPKGLQDLRLRYQGPAFYRVGRRILYRLDDLDRWIGVGRVEGRTPDPL